MLMEVLLNRLWKIYTSKTHNIMPRNDHISDEEYYNLSVVHRLIIDQNVETIDQVDAQLELIENPEKAKALVRPHSHN